MREVFDSSDFREHVHPTINLNDMRDEYMIATIMLRIVFVQEAGDVGNSNASPVEQVTSDVTSDSRLE